MSTPAIPQGEPLPLQDVQYQQRQPPPSRDWLAEAQSAFNLQDWGRTSFAAREALAQVPTSVAAWVLRGRSSFMLGRLEESEHELREAIRLRPIDAQPHAVLADTLEARGQVSGALHEIREAIRLDPNAWLYRVNEGSYLLGAGRTREAIKLFEELVKQPTDGTGFVATFLARALHADARGAWTELPGGKRIITNLEQVRQTRRNAERGLGLNIEDESVRSALKDDLAAANHAEELRWVPAANPLGYGLALVVVFVVAIVGFASGQIGGILFGLLCLLGCGALVYIYVLRHRKPVWTENAHTARLHGGR